MIFLACCSTDFLDEEDRTSSSSSSAETPRKNRRKNRRRFIDRRSQSIKGNYFTDHHSKMMSISTVVKTLSLRTTATKGVIVLLFLFVDIVFVNMICFNCISCLSLVLEANVMEGYRFKLQISPVITSWVTFCAMYEKSRYF